MGAYSIISDLTVTVANLLKDSLGNIISPEEIGPCEPGNRGDYTLGIHLYDIQENTQTRANRDITLPDGRIKPQPLSISLYLLISIASKGDISIRALEEQIVMGRVMQAMKEYQRLPEKFMPEALRQTGEPIMIEMLNMKLEDKIRVWSYFNQPYKISCFYRAGPVLIESLLVKEPAAKVKTFEIDTMPL